MKIIIAGAGAVGSHLAKMLSQENHDIVLIDPNEEKLKQIGANIDALTLAGSATSISLLINADIKKADLFIAVATSEEINITAAILAKKLGSQKTIARIDNQEYLFTKYRDHFVMLGIDYMIYPEKIAAREIVGLLQQTGSTDIIDFSSGKMSLYVIKLSDDAPFINKALKQFADKAENNEYRVVAITRNEKTIIPTGDDKFLSGDMVYVFSNDANVNELMKYSGKKKIDIKNIMILGGSRIGMLTAKDLGSQFNIKLIEQERSRSYELSNMLNNTLVINGDGRDMDLLMEEGLISMDAFIAVTGNSETNILSCMLAKKFGVKKTIAEVENMDYIALAENMGIDTIINKKIITAGRIFRFTASDAVSSVKCLTGTEAEVLEFLVKPGSKITQDPLNKINFPKDSIIGGVIRNGISFIANGKTEIKVNDRVLVFALPNAISKVSKFFS